MCLLKTSSMYLCFVGQEYPRDSPNSIDCCYCPWLPPSTWKKDWRSNTFQTQDLEEASPPWGLAPVAAKGAVQAAKGEKQITVLLRHKFYEPPNKKLDISKDTVVTLLHGVNQQLCHSSEDLLYRRESMPGVVNLVNPVNYL